MKCAWLDAEDQACSDTLVVVVLDDATGAVGLSSPPCFQLGASGTCVDSFEYERGGA